MNCSIVERRFLGDDFSKKFDLFLTKSSMMGVSLDRVFGLIDFDSSKYNYNFCKPVVMDDKIFIPNFNTNLDVGKILLVVTKYGYVVLKARNGSLFKFSNKSFYCSDGYYVGSTVKKVKVGYNLSVSC